MPESSEDHTDVSRLLQELRDGRREAFDDLFPLVYSALRELAHRQRRRWQGNETLNTTALVHEAYLKLGGQPGTAWQNEAHFLAAASRAVRHILINYARDQQAQKRGGGWQQVSLDEMRQPGQRWSLAGGRREQLLALDEALNRLSERDERQARIVECRFFGGMTIDQTAEALGISTATVTRGWAMARAWLAREMGVQPPAE